MASIAAWVSWLNLSILIGALALALFNASKDDIARNFAYAYALISAGVLVSNVRLTRDRFRSSHAGLRLSVVSAPDYNDSEKRSGAFRLVLECRSHPSLFMIFVSDAIIGPLVISAFLFLAIFANFFIRGMFTRLL